MSPRGAPLPENVDCRRTKPTVFGLFVVTLAIDSAWRSWKILVRDATRRPAAVTVRIDGGSPRTGVVLRTQVARVRADTWLTFRERPSTAGWWVVCVSVTGRSGRDTAMFNVGIGRPDRQRPSRVHP